STGHVLSLPAFQPFGTHTRVRTFAPSDGDAMLTSSIRDLTFVTPVMVAPLGAFAYVPDPAPAGSFGFVPRLPALVSGSPGRGALPPVWNGLVPGGTCGSFVGFGDLDGDADAAGAVSSSAGPKEGTGSALPEASDTFLGTPTPACARPTMTAEIGRAACRARVGVWGVA